MNDSRPNHDSKFNWRNIPRAGLPQRPPQDRVRDFLEIYGLYNEEQVREQASRCIQCPNPSCVDGCPLCNPIPKWMALTAEGRFLEAAAFLGAVTNMAEICARLCPQERLCEGSCLLGTVSDPVAIADIERFLMEYALVHGHADVATLPPTGFRVAVVGAGPGGLACADELASLGHSVEVLDESLLPGGLQWNGLPSFRLERSIIERRLDILKKRGVVFRLGVKRGPDFSLAELRKSFDAVYLGFDSRVERKLRIPGADSPSVTQALPFILKNAAPLPQQDGPRELAGKRVLVIGGGDEALDCVRTALRSEAVKAMCIYDRGEADLPCTPHEYRNAVEEGAEFIFHAAPLAIAADPLGRLMRVTIKPTRTINEAAQVEQAMPAEEFQIEADCVVTALGFEPAALPNWGDNEQPALSEHGGLATDSNQATSLPGVFAGGDLVRGPCTVLEAVRDARKAAAAIHERFTVRK